MGPKHEASPRLLPKSLAAPCYACRIMHDDYMRTSGCSSASLAWTGSASYSALSLMYACNAAECTSSELILSRKMLHNPQSVQVRSEGPPIFEISSSWALTYICHAFSEQCNSFSPLEVPPCLCSHVQSLVLEFYVCFMCIHLERSVLELLS